MAQVWDTAGQERFNAMGPAFYRGSEACILVYDVTDASSLESLARWKANFLKQLAIDESDADEFPFFVVGNKADTGKDTHEVDEEAGRNWSDKHRCIRHFQVSAKTGLNLDQMFNTVIREVVKRKKDRPEADASMIPDRVVIEEEPAKAEGCPC